MPNGKQAPSGEVLGMDFHQFRAALKAAGMADEGWKVILEEMVDELNEQHFVVPLEGRTVIASLEHDHELERKHLVYSKEADIRLRYRHREIKVGVKKDGFDIMQDIGSVWLKAVRRRNYRAVSLLPKGDCPDDVFNLWQGWGVEAAGGEWPIIQDHLLNVICSGNLVHYEWLLGWLAYTVQHPDRPAEVAVVLRGRKGIGKGSFAQILMKIFQHHALHISHGKHLTGNFNAHLADLLFLYVDEAFWAGDKAGESVLKQLITEKTLMIERKGIDAFQRRNRLKIVIASNNDWVVPASEDERRFFVLDVSDGKRGNLPYFKQLNAAIDGTETAALMDFLLKYDLTHWQHRSPPHTKALNDQKVIGADSVKRYWFNCLYEGLLLAADTGSDWPDDVPVQDLHGAYVNHTTAHGDRHPVTMEQFAKQLAPLMPNAELQRTRPRKEFEGDDRPRRYKLPALELCRAAMLAAMNIDPETHVWPDVEE